ncbi:MAG: DUF692 family protein [Pirellulales bacterium]|nr:DUF692 family protein [Pirellulales bacterium]
MLPAIGYAVRKENRTILSDPALNAVEITFEHADVPLRMARFLGDDEFDYVSVHALKLSVGSPDRPGLRYLDALKRISLENQATAVSDHLGFTRDKEQGVEIGHFAPVPLSAAALDATSRNVEFVQNYLAPMPFYLETIAYLFQLEGTMSEAEFLTQLLKRTGCGWLLDVTNVYANARNFGFDAYAFIDQVLPAADRVQMHLAGGYFDEEEGLYFDTHSQPVPEDVWSLYHFALERGRGKIDAVFIERDAEFPDDSGWRSELHRMRRIAEEVTGKG